MFNKIRLLSAVALLATSTSNAWAADALSAFSNTAPTAPFGYGGFNAGPASFSPVSNCFGVSGFECRQFSGLGGETPSIGKVNTAVDLGAATLDPNYLSVLSFRSGGPSVAIFYSHQAADPIRLRASYKLLADADPASMRVSIFRLTFNFGMPGPQELATQIASASNPTGSFEFIAEQTGSYGVLVSRNAFETGPIPQPAARTDWIGLNLEALPVAAPIPEPASWAMMLIGFGGLGAALRRRPYRLLA